MKRAVRCTRTAAVLLCVLLCCVPAGCGASGSSEPAFSRISFRLDAGETIDCFAQDDANAVVFLPSCARMDKLTVSLTDSIDAALDGVPLTDGMACGDLRTDTDYTLTAAGETATLRFTQSRNIASLYVHTQSGDMEFVHAHKTEKEPADLLLLTADGAVAYKGTGADKIRGRGNSTWSKAKKPYNLYLQTPADLLGLGKASDWALLANAFDETNLRNKVICDFASRASGDPEFAPGSDYVDVYLNGSYAGLYLLSEKTQIAENRLDIAPDSTLFSWVQTARNDSFFPLNSTASVEIESPKPCTKAQQRALETDLLAWQDALASGADWQSFIDLDSFAHKYLIEEIFLNYDIRNSQYFYREPNGKLFAGPCWDYDLTLGISWRNAWSTPNGFSAQNKQDENETWYSLLWKQDVFRTRVLTLFRQQYLPLLQELADKGIDAEASRIAAASEMNALRWRSLFGEKTSGQAVDEMTRFLTDRVAFLKAAWVDETPFCTLTLLHPVKYEYISVPPNTVCTRFPQPQELDLAEGTVWIDAQTGEPFDPETVITHDITLKLPPQEKTLDKRMFVVIGSVAAMAGLIVLTAAADRFKRNKRRKRA